MGAFRRIALTAVHTELNRLGIPTVFLDQRDILDTEIDLCAHLSVSCSLAAD